MDIGLPELPDNVVMIRYIQKNKYLHKKVYKFTAPAGIIKRLKRQQGNTVVVNGHFNRPQPALVV